MCLAGSERALFLTVLSHVLLFAAQNRTKDSILPQVPTNPLPKQPDNWRSNSSKSTPQAHPYTPPPSVRLAAYSNPLRPKYALRTISPLPMYSLGFFELLTINLVRIIQRQGALVQLVGKN